MHICSKTEFCRLTLAGFLGVLEKILLGGIVQSTQQKTITQKQGGFPMTKYASLFSQLIALIDRKKFHSLVYRHQSERCAKKFNSWEHFVSMLFCQLAKPKV